MPVNQCRVCGYTHTCEFDESDCKKMHCFCPPSNDKTCCEQREIEGDEWIG